jgi:alpha-2-macroglobulin
MAAYAIAGRKDISIQIVRNLRWVVKPYQELSYTYGSDIRDKAMILESMSLMGMQTTAEPLFQEVIGNMNTSEFMNTQEAAYSLLSVCTWANGNRINGVQYRITDHNGKNLNTNIQKSVFTLDLKEKNHGNSDFILVKNTGKSTLYIRQVWRGSPFAGNEIAESKGLEMGWSFSDNLNHYLNPVSIAAGTDFTAKISLKNTSKTIYREMALKEILPGGWEIIDSRLFGESTSSARYANMRDDRVYYYFDLSPGETKIFTLRLHASYEGSFYLPGPYAEAMYDQGIHAGVKGLQVKVTKSIPGA